MSGFNYSRTSTYRRKFKLGLAYMQRLHRQRCFTENRFVLTVDSHTETDGSHFTISILGGRWVPAEHVLCAVSGHPTFLLCHCQLLRKVGFSSRHTKRYLPASNHHLSTRHTGWGQQPGDAAACSSCSLDRSKCKKRSSQTFPPLPIRWSSCSASQSTLPQLIL